MMMINQGILPKTSKNAAQIRYIKESEEIHLAMQPLELIKRISMASNLNEYIIIASHTVWHRKM
jgi:hypothetical protein